MHATRRLGIILSLAVFFLPASWPQALFAQVSSTHAPIASQPHQSLSALKQHPETWPAQVNVKADTQLTITRNGVPAGSVLAPAGSTVQLLGVDGTTVQIGVASAQASVDPDRTDLWERLAKAPPAPTLAPTVATATPSPTPAAPASPTPTPTPAPVVAATAPALASSTPLEFDYNAPPGEGYGTADFHFWSPAYQQPVRGLIIMVPGSDGDGRGMANDGAWQALARKYRLALVGCFFKGGNYSECSGGSGDALHDAIHSFADQSGHPEVATVPLLLWGISAGGQFNYNYVLWKPDNVMAFVVNKGGYYNGAEAESRCRSTPGLFFLGQSDADYRITAITRIWTAGRKNGALWALAPQPNSGHEFSKTDPVARVFFEAVLKVRLPDDSLSSDPAPMNPMEEGQGWLGNLTTHEVHAESSDGQADLNAAWLPDEATAQAWKVFVSGG
jgi:hypothetical protein